jgi:hypothetical protein
MSTNIHPCVKELSETALNLDADLTPVYTSAKNAVAKATGETQ